MRIAALAMIWVLVLASVRGSLTAAAGEQEGGPAAPRERHCLWMPQLNRVEIVDDFTLVFHMSGGKRYVNILPYRCSGLKRRGTFLHETATNNYCDLDTITVIDTSTGMRLNSCPLGKFELIEDEVEPPATE